MYQLEIFSLDLPVDIKVLLLAFPFIQFTGQEIHTMDKLQAVKDKAKSAVDKVKNAFKSSPPEANNQSGQSSSARDAALRVSAGPPKKEKHDVD